MRLLAFYQFMPPYPGAVARRGYSLAEGFAKQPALKIKYDLQFYTATPNAILVSGVSIIYLPGNEIKNIDRLYRRAFNELKLGWAAGRKMFNDSKTAGVWVSSPPYLTACVIIFFAIIKRVPYILELRDLYPQVYAEAGLLRRNSVIYEFLSAISRFLYKKAKAIIVVTDGLKKIVIKESGDTPVIPVWNGFPEDLLKIKWMKHKRFTVCCHGVLGYLQDVEAIRGIAELLVVDDIDFLVIGYGRKASLLTCDRPQNLRFLGTLPFEQTIIEVSRCHVGLSLLLENAIAHTAFPTKVWEYIGLGIPSIVTPRCEAGIFLERNHCGFQFPAGDIEGIARAILELKKNPSQLEKMTSCCAKTAPSFTREKMAEVAAGYVAHFLGLGEKKNATLNKGN